MLNRPLARPGRRLRRLAQLSALCLGAWCSIATSPAPVCYFGIAPFDGQTDVPLDTTITLQYGEALPPDFPAVTEAAAGLYTWPEMTRVETTVSVELEAGRILLTPVAPLTPGRFYFASGVDLDALDSAHYLMGDLEMGSELRPAEATFQTASSPHALKLVPQNGRIVLIFSEGLELSSLTPERIALWARESADAEAVSLPWTAVTQHAGKAHILEFTVPELDTSFSFFGARLSPELLGLSGVGLDGDRDLTGGEPEDEQVLETGLTSEAQAVSAALGEASCTDY